MPRHLPDGALRHGPGARTGIEANGRAFSRPAQPPLGSRGAGLAEDRVHVAAASRRAEASRQRGPGRSTTAAGAGYGSGQATDRARTRLVPSRGRTVADAGREVARRFSWFATVPPRWTGIRRTPFRTSSPARGRRLHLCPGAWPIRARRHFSLPCLSQPRLLLQPGPNIGDGSGPDSPSCCTWTVRCRRAGQTSSGHAADRPRGPTSYPLERRRNTPLTKLGTGVRRGLRI